MELQADQKVKAAKHRRTPRAMNKSTRFAIPQCVLLILALWLMPGGVGCAEETAAAPARNESARNESARNESARNETAVNNAARDGDEPVSGLNIRWQTFGGRQFWADELVFRGWRIQRNVFTSHYRLLDDRDVRLAWGDWDACLEKLEAQKAARDLPPLRGKVVVLVHGLGRSRKFMRPLAEYLQKNSDYETVSVDYPSTRAGIDSHAAGLASVIEHLDDEVTEINFVAHSLGGLVVRHYLADATEDGKKLDERIGRFVMLGPPNQGAAMARLFEDSRLFHWAIRGTGKQLSTNFDELSEHLGTPPCEFAILAGGRGDDEGYNPLIAGDDDILVRVAETKLAGARDFRRLDMRHTKLARERQPLSMTLQFLQEGHFTTDDERQPLK